MTNVRHIGPSTLGSVLREHHQNFARVGAVLGIPPVDWAAPKVFTFRRHRTAGIWGWEVGLKIGPFWMNLSCSHSPASPPPAPFLRSLEDARAWAVDFASQHGFKAMEKGKPPKKMPRPKLTVLDGGRASVPAPEEGTR